MNTPTFELDRPSAASIVTLDVDSPMMQAPVGRWLWSCLRRRRAHWRFGVKRESLRAHGRFWPLIGQFVALSAKIPGCYTSAYLPR
jgi:hypothetical protein